MARESAIMGLLGIVLAASGCTVRLMSEYDAETDQAITALQSDVALHLARLVALSKGPDDKAQHPACEFANFTDLYRQFAARAHVIDVRNSARRKNNLTTQQIEGLYESLATELPTLHREATGSCLTAGAITAAEASLDQHFRAILKLELAKKTYRAAEAP